MGLPEERQQVVFAERVELDVAYHDHALVRFGEYGVAHDLIDLEGVPSREPGQGVGDARWRATQPFARRVFPEELQHAPHQRLELGVVLRARIEVEAGIELGELERGGVDATVTAGGRRRAFRAPRRRAWPRVSS